MALSWRDRLIVASHEVPLELSKRLVNPGGSSSLYLLNGFKSSCWDGAIFLMIPGTSCVARRGVPQEGAGDAEGLGRLNLVAASAALADTAQMVSTREAIAKERSLWLSVLRELNLSHTDSRANFVFFDVRRPQPILAASMRERGVDIGRAHPPYTNWARITIGLPSENLRAQNALRMGLKETEG